MPDEISGVSPIAIDRTNQDHPRRDQQQGSRRQPRKPAPRQPAPVSRAAGEDPPLVGSRLDVRA